MKKFTFFTFSILMMLKISASAQIQKGNVLVGGDLADISLGLNSPNVFDFNITPKAAWFIQDNIALGGYANLGIQTAKNHGTTFSYGLGALGRYYAGNDMTVLKHGRFFAEATIGFGGVNVSGSNGDGGSNTNGLNLSVGPGFAYFVTPSIGLEALLKYNGLTGFGNQSFQSTLTFNFGFQVYLPGQSTAEKIKGDVK